MSHNARIPNTGTHASQTTDNKKAHAPDNEGMGLLELIASYQPATPEHTARIQATANLQQLLGNDKLIYIHDDIQTLDPDTGQPNQLSTAGEYVFTADSIAVILYDETFTPSNLIFYPLTSKGGQQAGKPFLLHNDGRISNFVACENWQTGTPAGEIIITSDLENAIAIYLFLDSDLARHTLIAPYTDKGHDESWNIINTIKAISSQQPVTVITDYSTDRQGRAIRDIQAKAFSRHNVTLITTPEPVKDLLGAMTDYGIFTYPQLLAQSDIQVFDNYVSWHDGKALLDTPVKYEGGRFELYNDGLYFVRYEYDNDTSEYLKKYAIKLCSPLFYKASIRSKDSTAWGILLAWHDRDNKAHEWAMPADLLQGDSKEYRQILAFQGLDIAPSIKARNYLTAYLQTYTTPHRALSVNKTGWHGDSYVLPHKVIAPPTGEPIVLQTTSPLEHGYSEAGTLEQWREQVSQPVATQSRVAFALSCAFAGQLFDLINEDMGGGFHFVGNSSIGKSITLAIAGSVWGNKTIKSWRSTDNAMENIALLHNDNLLCLDEINEAEPRTIGKTIYMLANGQGKGRMTKTGSNRHSPTWRVIVLSNGEQTLETYLRQAGETIKAGQEVRLCNIEADTGKGLGIFDSLIGADMTTEPSTPALSPAKQAETLKHHASRLYGVAGIAWLEYLTQHKAHASETAKDLNRQFLAHYPTITGQAKRVANRFALVATAGELATQAGITGWQGGQATQAVKACFNNWLANYGDIGNHEERQIIKQVQGFLQAHGASRFTDWHADYTDRIPNRAGFYRKDTTTLYYIYPSVFENEVCKAFSKKQVASVLDGKGLLHTSHGYQLNVKSTNSDKKGYFYCIKGEVLELPLL